jgi:hypothetical protein
LDALAARESNGKKVILPVWHNVDKDYVLKKSPLLADRFAARSSDGVENIVRMISAKIRKDAPGTVMAEMEGILSALENKKIEEMKQVISQEDFAKLRKEYRNVLCGIGFFDISPTPSNINIFRYLREAIVNRPENEAKALFEVLLEWYVETTTPFSNEMLLEIFSGLVKLPFAKDAVREKKFSKLFVTEFGKSHNWDRALITTQILVNIQSLLSKSEKARIVEYIISNDQIYSSYAAKGYLQKLLDYFEGDVDPGRRFSKEIAWIDTVGKSLCNQILIQ